MTTSPSTATTSLPSVQHFDALFAGNDDPWEFKTRWYEARKRALTLACLPDPRYASAYEPGCANGELSAALAARCDWLLASDGSARAASTARDRLGGLQHVDVRQVWVPDEWPDESFDLIVISELGYYLRPEQIDALAARILASLRPGGTVLGCHWRRPINGCVLNGDQVQERLGESLALPHLCRLLEPDVRLDVWCTDARSVAQREGLN